MLTRLFIDNFRCFVNFELRLDRQVLLLGGNGSGKTSVFEALRRLQSFVLGEVNVDAAFPSGDLTRWQDLRSQQFELDFQVKDFGAYSYRLIVQHSVDRRLRRVQEERLLLDNKPLFSCADAVGQFCRDDESRGPEILVDHSRSGLSMVLPRDDNKRLTQFKDRIRRMIVVGFNPFAMSPETTREQDRLSAQCENFASWYRYLSQEHQGNVFALLGELRQFIDGFDSFSLREAGERRILKALFRHGESGPQAYNFDEISEGQRTLFVVYALLYGLKGLGCSLFLDEPDNWLTLREIQPWLMALQDACGSDIEQAIVISHHPEVIDYLGQTLRYFERPNYGSVRVTDELPTPNSLSLSETIQRGWESTHGQS